MEKMINELKKLLKMKEFLKRDEINQYLKDNNIIDFKIIDSNDDEYDKYQTLTDEINEIGEYVLFSNGESFLINKDRESICKFEEKYESDLKDNEDFYNIYKNYN